MDLLKLVALDPEDLAIISAHLQDALLRVGDIVYLPKERRFAIEVRRFDWEAGDQPPQRRLTCMHFEQVTGVRVRGIDQTSKDAVLNLLAIIVRGDRRTVGHRHPDLRRGRSHPGRSGVRRNADEGCQARSGPPTAGRSTTTSSRRSACNAATARRAGRRRSRSAFAALLSAKREVSEDVDQAVRAIIEDVVARGDEALIDYTHGSTDLALTPETLRISTRKSMRPRPMLAEELCGARLSRRNGSRSTTAPSGRRIT